MNKEDRLIEEEKMRMRYHLPSMNSNDVRKLSDAFIIKYIDCFDGNTLVAISKGKKKRSLKVYQIILDRFYAYYRLHNGDGYNLRAFLKELLTRNKLSKRFLEKNKDKIPQSVWEDLYK
jgi:hypothetical protein